MPGEFIDRDLGKPARTQKLPWEASTISLQTGNTSVTLASHCTGALDGARRQHSKAQPDSGRMVYVAQLTCS